MDSSRMRTVRCSGCLSYHAHPLPHMPPDMHAPCHTCPSVMHTSPATRCPCYACRPPHMPPPCHAHPLPHMSLLPHMPPAMHAPTMHPLLPAMHASPAMHVPPVNRITDRCKNITLPQLRCRRQLFVYGIE